MSAVTETLRSHGHWVIMYDLGATALSDSFGSCSRHYREVKNILVRAGFVRVQQSVFRHSAGCYLLHVVYVLLQIRQLPWAGGADLSGAPHIISIRISNQVNPYMDFTNFVCGGPAPHIPLF